MHSNISIDSNFSVALESLSTLSAIKKITPIQNGINSKVFLSAHTDGSQKVTKFYPNDRLRDRQRSEEYAIKLMREVGIKNIPVFEKIDRPNNFSIFTHVPGKPNPSIDKEDIPALINFQRKLQKIKHSGKAAEVLFAADACPNLVDVQHQVQSRLTSLELAFKSNVQMTGYLSNTIRPWIDSTIALAIDASAKHNIDYYNTLSPEQLTYIASDFGSHNIIRSNDGKFTFVDFEYFGLDSPVTEMCNFILHPGMNLSSRTITCFLEEMIGLQKEITNLRTLLKISLPLFQLRWAMIILKPTSIDVNTKEQKIIQSTKLEKVNDLINFKLAYDLT